MNPEFLRGATFSKYGTTLYVGIGIPIPILNERLAQSTSITDADILTNIVDYGTPRRDRPKLGKVSYKDLKSGTISILDRKVTASSLSSLKTARNIAEMLKAWIQNGSFYLSAPVERLPLDTVFKPMAPPKFASEDLPPSEHVRNFDTFHEVKIGKISQDNKRRIAEADQEECIQCGACISLCPQRAIELTEDCSVSFDKQKCRGEACGVCLDSCPVRAIHFTHKSPSVGD